jgi:hypothetical protein
LNALPGLTQTASELIWAYWPQPQAKKSPIGHLDRGLGLAVPVEAQDVEAPVQPRGRHPDLLDRAGFVDLAQGERALGRP